MKMRSVTVEDFFGAVMAKGIDSAGSVRRYWFDETDAGRMALCAIVVEVTETSGRMYLDESDWSVPQHIRDALTDAGYDGDEIYNTRGFEID